MIIHLCTYFLLLALRSAAPNVQQKPSNDYYVNIGMPNYLYHKFDYVTEDIFPYDIRINVSFSKFDGTLLYSIDKHMNQLIMTLIPNEKYLLEVRLNQQKFVVSLVTLCGCEWCMFQPLLLRIQINSHINLQCNFREIERTPNLKKHELDENYPIMYSKATKNATRNEAHIWLVNTFEYGKVYPNPDQMKGCIFQVLYGDEPLTFTNQTKTILKQCTKKCYKNVCNGGQCYETYNSYPLCNCTATFRNGAFCNENMTQKNQRKFMSHYKFQMIKISWNSSAKQIFVLNNSNIHITIERDESKLAFVYNRGSGIVQLSKVILSHDYVLNRQYIAILYFKPSAVDIHLFINGSWERIKTTVRDTNKEEFGFLELRSGNGTIDMVSKDFHEYNWGTVIFKNSTELPPEVYQDNRNSSFTATSKEVEWLAVLIIIPLSLVAMIVVFKWKRKFKKQRPSLKNNEEGRPLNPDETDFDAKNNPQCSTANNESRQSRLSKGISYEDRKYGQTMQMNTDSKFIQKWLTFDIINESLANPDMSLTLSMLAFADALVYSSVVERVLYKTSQNDNKDLFKTLISNDISRDGLLENGETLLGCLIKERKLKFCSIILKSINAGILLEKKDVNDKLPLHICIENDVPELIEQIILDTKASDEEDKQGYTPLALLLERLSKIEEEDKIETTMKYIKMLINKQANIKKVNHFHRIIISFCTKKEIKEEIEEYHKRHGNVALELNQFTEMKCYVCGENGVDCVLECGHVLCMSCGRGSNACQTCQHEPANPKQLLL